MQMIIKALKKTYDKDKRDVREFILQTSDRLRYNVMAMRILSNSITSAAAIFYCWYVYSKSVLVFSSIISE